MRKPRMNHISSIFGLSLLLFCTLTFPSQAQNRVVDLAMGVSATVVGRGVGETLNTDSPGSLTGDFQAISADVNGDTVSDLIIGLPLADGPDGTRPGAGRVYVVFGQRGLPPGATLDLLVTPPGVTVYGAGEGDRLGASLATGDVNGDGVQDVLISAPQADEPDRPNVGKVYVLFGGSGLGRSATRDMAPGSATGPDVTVIGWGGADKKNEDMAGISVAAGDVSGDGIDDILVGAPGLQGNDNRRAGGASIPGLGRVDFGADGGAVYVFFGRRNWPSGTVLDASMGLPAGVNMVFYGRLTSLNAFTNVGDSVGSTVAAGDVNGDGIADIITGAPSASPTQDKQGAGTVYVIFGRRRTPTDPPLAFDVDQRPGAGRRLGPPPDATITGIKAFDLIGSTLAAGDINGDTRADIIIGAANLSGPGDQPARTGRVLVILGTQMLPATRDLANGADLTIFGADQGDLLGFSVAVGDVNGDRIADLLIGAPTADGPTNSRPSAGEVYVLFGRANLTGTLDFAQPNQGPNVTIVGANSPDQIGFTVAAGDFNGDGIADIVTTSPFAASTGLMQQIRLGLTLIVFGQR